MFNVDEPLYSLQRRRCRMREQNNGFVFCVLVVDIHQSGWYKAVSSILKSGQNLNKLLRSLEKKGRRVRSVIDIRHGLCSHNVYGPDIASISTSTAGMPPFIHPMYPYPHQYQHGRRLFPDHRGPLTGKSTCGCCSLM